MDYIIVGGGISGLYCAYILHKKHDIKNIIVLEKNNRLGGRIDTMYVNDIPMEMGAARVVDLQKNIMALLEELDLIDKLGKGSNDKSLVVTSTIPTSNYGNKYSEIIPTIYQITDIVDIKKTDFYDILDTLTRRLDDDEFYQTALTYNLYALIEKFYGFEKADQLVYQFGYHSNFYDQNSIEALGMFAKEFSKNAKYHGINGGMIQIINKLSEYLTKNNINIELNSECIDIDKQNGQYVCLINNNRKMIGKNIVFAIPKINLLKICFFENIFTKLNSVFHKPLIKIYVFFPLVDGKVWFDKINSTLTTRTIMNQIIPYNKEKGILLMYCDNINAETWYYFEKRNILERELMYHLTKLFSDQIIPDPIKIYTCYHDSASHVWKPHINPKQMYEDIVKPYNNENIYIVGEAYSLNQQWSEGAIQSVNHLMDKIFGY